MDDRASVSRRLLLSAGGALAASIPFGCSSSENPPTVVAPLEVEPTAEPKPTSTATVVAPVGKPWAIGAFLPLSGGDEQFGLETRDGIDLAVEEVNAAGGVRGAPLKILYEDDRSMSGEATMRVQKLIDRDGVIALLGEVASSRSIPGGIVATKRGVPMISPASTNVEVTKGKDFVFRVCFIDEFQGEMAAEFCVKSLGKKRIGLAFAEDDIYSQGLAEQFKTAAEKRGARIVVRCAFSQQETSFATVARQLNAKKPELIYAPVYYKQMLQLGRAGNGVGLPNDMWLGSDGWSGERELLKQLDGAYFTDHFSPDLKWAPTVKFVAAFQSKHHELPSSLAAMGYDATLVLADAIRRAEEPKGKALRDAIAATKDFPGASGLITIDAERNATKAVVVLQIRDGQTRTATVVGPGADRILGK